MREIAVFSGSAHPCLAAEICENLAAPLQPLRIQRFANDCLEVQLQANCRERDVFIIQPLVTPVQEHLVELLLMLDAARGASAGAAHGGHAALRLRPLGQEERAAHLHRRAAGGRPAGHRRRQPDADHDPALPRRCTASSPCRSTTCTR